MRENKIAILVDGSNLSAACRAAGFRVDYKKVLEHYAAQGQIVYAGYFTALPPRDVKTGLRNLTDWLQYNDWFVESKETKDHITSDGIFKTKGNMDVEITVKAMQLIDKITHLVLFSGDGDFCHLVKTLQTAGVHVTAISHFSWKDDCQVSDDLRRQVNSFLDLKSQRGVFSLERRDKDIDERKRNFLDGK